MTIFFSSKTTYSIPTPPVTQIVKPNFEKTTFQHPKAMAVTFVNEKFPAHGITRISERIIMYRHDYNSSNILQVSEYCQMPKINI